MSIRVLDEPTHPEIHRAYLTPQSSEHWQRIDRLVLSGGFKIEPNPQGTQTNNQNDFRVSWPSKEREEHDYKIFYDACCMVIKTIHLDDAIFSQSTLPKIFEVLQTSYLFQQLFSKVSNSQGNTVRHHVETVPKLIKTSDISMQDRFILRLSAIFHDVGKAFNIRRDQVHYHALIASNIVSWFLLTYQNKIINTLCLADKQLEDTILINRTSQKSLSRNELEVEFLKISSQITEIIRLHHVLEQIDKGVLDLEVVASIFAEKKVNSLVFGLFAIADGASVIPDKSMYAGFLIQNLNIYIKLINLLEYQNVLQDETVSKKIKMICMQSLQYVIQEVAGRSNHEVEKVKKIVQEFITTVDKVLAVALVGLQAQLVV